MKRIFFVTAIFLITLSVFSQEGVSNVGIKKEEINLVKAKYNSNEWCFAADIQMVLNFYGVSIDQKEIVEHIYGINSEDKPVNKNKSTTGIKKNLDGWVINNNGHKFKIKADLFTGFNLNVSTSELKKRHPLILTGYRGNPTGHSLLLTEVGYQMVQDGAIYRDVLKRIFEIDPFPENFSLIRGLEYLNENALEFTNNVESTWVIKGVYI